MPNPALLDIFMVEVPLRASSDSRPVIVVCAAAGEYVEVVPLSSAIDLYSPSKHFLIDRDADDFGATGLRCSSYATTTTAIRIPLKQPKKKLGRLEGELARKFKEWFGI